MEVVGAKARPAVGPKAERDAWIREVYADRVARKGLGVALDEMEREIAERGWDPIGGRQIRRVASGS